MYYAGPTLGVRDEIESQVVIDFEKAFSIENEERHRWTPRLETLIGEGWSEPDTEVDSTTCAYRCCNRDQIAGDSWVDGEERSRYIKSLLSSSDGSVAQPSIAILPRLLKELKDSSNTNGYAISDDELVIMSCRVVGFVLRQRRWGKCTSSLMQTPTDLAAC